MVSPYLIVIGFSLVVILSYFFNLISRYTNIPSVLLLIGTGIGLNLLAKSVGFELPELMSLMSVLGVTGLVMIVLEAALDLEIRRDNLPMVGKAFLSAAVILGVSTALIALVIRYFIGSEIFTSIMYAIPLSVVSSAIVIPSVTHCRPDKKEFLIYEATFSDILGIMLFDFMLFSPEGGQSLGVAISLNVIISVVASFVLGYLLIYLFQRIRSEVKFFLFLAIIALIFSIGKYFNYSALLAVLIFGLLLENYHTFFKGKIGKLLDEKQLVNVRKEFRTITIESSFLVRTFFFIVFGMTINLNQLEQVNVIYSGLIILGILYMVRIANLRMILRTNLMPEILMAPRGLVSILLFYKIPEEYIDPNFKPGVLLFVILGSNLLMMLGLIISQFKKKPAQPNKEDEFLQTHDVDNPFKARDKL